MRFVHIGLLACLALSGCANESDWDSEVDAKIQSQMDEYDAQTEEVDRQLVKAKQQAVRYDALLDRWEAQADRHDQLLDKLESKASAE